MRLRVEWPVHGAGAEKPQAGLVTVLHVDDRAMAVDGAEGTACSQSCSPCSGWTGRRREAPKVVCMHVGAACVIDICGWRDM